MILAKDAINALVVCPYISTQLVKIAVMNLSIPCKFNWKKLAIWAAFALAVASWAPVLVEFSQPFMTGAWVDKSGSLILLDMQMHTFSLVLCVLVIFRRQIGLLDVSVALALAAASRWGGKDFFTTVVHPFFLEHAIYPQWLGKGSSAAQSHQYAKVLIGAVVAVALGLMLLVRRWRTIDRLYVWLIGSSVLVTTVLFHFMIREAIFESRAHQKAVMALAVEAPKDWIFKAMCQHQKLECHEATLSGGYPVTGNATLDAETRRMIDSTRGYAGATFSYSASVPLSGGLNDYHVIYHWTSSSSYRMAVEREQWHRTLQKFQLIYSWIGIPAHLLWIGGGLYLLYWHRRRFAKRSDHGAAGLR